MDFRPRLSFRKDRTVSRSREHRSRLLSPAVLLCLSAAVAPALGGPILTVLVVDSGSGELVPARCSVVDSLGQSRFPYIYSSLYHTYGGGYFYADGDFAFSVPGGRTVIRIARGPEYYPYVDTLTILGDTTVTCELERFVDMRGAGWYSGDVEVHIDHIGGIYNLDPADAHWVGRAENLDFVNCLDNGFHFTGGPDPVSTEDCIVYMSEELRSFVYGHCALPGLKGLVLPSSTGWGTLLMDVADSVHAQDGPLMIYSHPVTTHDYDQIEDWPGSGLGRELPVDVIQGKVDAVEVMSYSNVDGGIELDMWYALLNCGFRMPPCAGSDAAVNRYTDAPMGGFRVYVEHEGDTPDIYQWLDGISAGRTFVTNGPLFTEFDMLGSWGIGDSLYIFRNTYKIILDLTAVCAFPMDRVDILMNGRVVDTLVPGGDPRVISGRSEFFIFESCWIAAMACGPAVEWVTVGDRLFAHTGAFYFDYDGEHIHKREAVLFLAERVDSLIDLALEKGEWAAPEDSIRLFDELYAAKSWYMDLMGVTSGTEDHDGNTVPPALSVTVYPNPFSGSAEISFNASFPLGGGRSALMSPGPVPVKPEVTVYDLSGRPVRRLLPGEAEGGRFQVTWDGRNDAGRPAASGIYFCRVRSGEMESSAKMLLIR